MADNSQITITSQPVDYEGAIGDIATFTVAATGDGLTYQWQWSNGERWRDSGASGSNTPTLRITMRAQVLSESYRCSVRDTHGHRVNSNVVRMVEVPPNGYQIISTALLKLVNRYPGLDTGETIGFADMGMDGGIALFPAAGAVIERELKTIIGEVYQTCRYSMYVRYVVAGQTQQRRINVKEWLDDLGRWLEGQSITVAEDSYQLAKYPALTGDRRFLDIRHQSPAFLDSIDQDQVETWAISLIARYEQKFTLLR